MENAQELQNFAEEIEKSLMEIEFLLCAPEVIADSRIYNKFVSDQMQLQKKLEAARKCVDALESGTEDEAEQCIAQLKKVQGCADGKGAHCCVKLEVKTQNKTGKVHDGASILQNAYQGFCEKNGLVFEAAGEGEIIVFGEQAKAFCGENGVHKMFFEGGGRCDVSVLVFEFERSEICEIKEGDIRTDTFRSGGAGGQHVNRTESAVRFTHMPTGITVVCQDERSQIKNKDRAFTALIKKVSDHFEKENKAKNDKERAKARSDSGRIIRVLDFEKFEAKNDGAGFDADILPSGAVRIKWRF